jgi:hypothetical protein
MLTKCGNHDQKSMQDGIGESRWEKSGIKTSEWIECLRDPDTAEQVSHMGHSTKGRKGRERRKENA